ncbi:MAG: hypothetical protein LPK26_08765 [Bacillaceae bacterium]|nr:hypothetical protein [Bacillaceae bacterium]
MSWEQAFLQIIIPVIGGTVGGLITILWAEFKFSYNFRKKVVFTFILIGAVAGFVAVNLLNPNGSFSEIAALSVLAGLNGMSFLISHQLAEGKLEDEALKNSMEAAHKAANMGIDEEFEVSEEELEQYLNAKLGTITYDEED